MKNIKILIEYDGTNYSGWQKQKHQKNVKTIQGILEKKIRDITGENIELIASGRTDKGVHAIEQVANFKTSSTIPPKKIKYCINRTLPPDIYIKKSSLVECDFHARFDAKYKIYKYVVYNNKDYSPIIRNRAYHVYRCIDIEKIKKATNFFIGEKDFKAFMAAKTEVDTTIRTIENINIETMDGFIIFSFYAKSYLRHMIRIVVGTLIDVGVGKIDLEEIDSIIRSKDRKRAGITAPAQGLYLEKVIY